MRRRLNKIHLKLSKNKKIVLFFIKLRNQLNSIINYHITNTIDFNKNGESIITEFISKKSDTIIDIGANVGQYTEKILKSVDINKVKIYLFEPGREIFKKLEQKFNNPNIFLNNIAISNKKGSAIFYEIENYGETSSLHLATVKNNKIKPHKVIVDTIDNLFSNIESIDFIKIDTEGNDFFVLKGAEEKLKKAQIKYIQFEYNFQWLHAGSSLIAAIHFLNSKKYVVFLIRHDGLYKFNYDLYGDFFHYANFFAVHENYLETIQPIIKGTF